MSVFSKDKIMQYIFHEFPITMVVVVVVKCGIAKRGHLILRAIYIVSLWHYKLR